MNTQLDTKRIYIYLAFAFGIAWAAALAVYLTGGLQNSPVVVDGTRITLAVLLIASVVMWAPALAHIFTRLLTREGWEDTWLKPYFRRAWPYWLVAWFVPGLLTMAGLALFFTLFPRYYDPTLKSLRELLAATAPEADVARVGIWVIAAAQVVQGMLISPLVNGLATFGEEFGWRAYLQPKLMPLGGRKAMLLMGVIWGVWHWPIILMGHNYGLDYPGAPWLGLLAMVWFALVLGIFLGWLTLKANSVWPAVIGHAAINGMAGLGVIFTRGNPNPLLGPLPVGIVGGAGFLLVALLIYFSPHTLEPAKK